jgi:hypothetical protein
MTRYSFTQPICLDCWSSGHGEKQPARLVEPDVEICAYCGEENEDGIYIRVDPSTVPWPTLTKDE